MYAGVALLGIVLIYFLLPETKGRPLEEVVSLFGRPWCRCCGGGQGESQYRPLLGETLRDGEGGKEELLFADLPLRGFPVHSETVRWPTSLLPSLEFVCRTCHVIGGPTFPP